MLGTEPNAVEPVVNVTMLHAEISELPLANDLARALGKAGGPEGQCVLN